MLRRLLPVVQRQNNAIVRQLSTVPHGRNLPHADVAQQFAVRSSSSFQILPMNPHQQMFPQMTQISPNSKSQAKPIILAPWSNTTNGLQVLLDEFPDQSPADELVYEASSTLKKRRLKMNRHKYRKRRKRDRKRSK